MSNDRSLTHISLDTGRVRSSPRSEVGDQAIRWLRPFLKAALAGQIPPVPGRPAWFSARARGTAFCARVYGRVYGERRADLEGPVITFAVARERAESDALWRLLHQGRPAWMYPFATDPEQPPQLPWLADRMEPGIVDNFRMLSWLANFETHLVWTWIEHPR
jgi:hypothetical protein